MMELPGRLGIQVRMIDGAARLDDPPLFDLHASYLLICQISVRPRLCLFDPNTLGRSSDHRGSVRRTTAGGVVQCLLVYMAGGS